MGDFEHAIAQVQGATQDLKEYNDRQDREQEERDRLRCKYFEVPEMTKYQQQMRDYGH